VLSNRTSVKGSYQKVLTGIGRAMAEFADDADNADICVFSHTSAFSRPIGAALRPNDLEACPLADFGGSQNPAPALPASCGRAPTYITAAPELTALDAPAAFCHACVPASCIRCSAFRRPRRRLPEGCERVQFVGLVSPVLAPCFLHVCPVFIP
jgi:hypothetical protein